ncbi:hypothetical protein WH52_13960, partial [Tenacibaculum holothuriorum]
TLKKLDLNNNGLTSLPSTINNLTKLESLEIQYNEINSGLDLSNLELLKVLTIQYNNIYELKLNLSPTAFRGSNNNYSIQLRRNAIGCIEVPSDELVAWQLAEINEERGYIDNGVIYSDNCSAVTTNSIPDIEREALIAIYNSTKGTDWKNDLSSSYNGVPWVADATQKRNVGAWFGVTTAIINGQKHVTKIELNSNLLEGALPEEIKNLTELVSLKINSNAVNELAKEIGELPKLEVLEFNSQRNSSNSEYVLKEIPSEINNITTLKRLGLNGNQLEGNLDFSNLTNLTSLDVNSNQITGLKIGVSPNVFDGQSNGSLNFSNTFSFSSNQYLYCIAVSQNTIADWEGSSYASSYPNIVWGQDCSAYNNVPTNEIQALVDMYNNLDGANWTNNSNWTGDLSKATINSPYNATKWQGVTTEIINGGKHITQLTLNSNKLKGELPESLGNLTKIKLLYLQNNEISGVIPTSVGNMIEMETMYVNNNELTGSLPEGIKNYTKLQTLIVENNKLEGNVPDLTAINTLSSLNIRNNKFQFGDFEDEFATYKSNINSFSYSPQAKIGEDTSEDLTNADYRLDAVVSGDHNEYQWYKDNSPIQGATEASYDILSPTSADDGIYYCRITNTVVTNLTIETGKITLKYDTSLSTEDEELEKAVKLYPNPTKGLLNLNISNQFELKKIEIYTVLGKKIREIKANSGLKNIDISNLSSGMYLINIVTEKGRVVKRVMRE